MAQSFDGAVEHDDMPAAGDQIRGDASRVLSRTTDRRGQRSYDQCFRLNKRFPNNLRLENNL